MAETHAGNLKLLGGRLCLDFTNTVDWHASEHPVEFLLSYEDLVAWGRHVELLTDVEASHLRALAQVHPDQAQQVLKRAIDLREALMRIFPRAAEGHAPNPDDLALLNAVLAEAPARSQISWQGTGCAWIWHHSEDDLQWMLWPVAWSAADLLVSEDLRRVKLCPGPGCGWLFVDASRNQSRRWCSMESCGNRAKVQRHYRRTRQA